MIRDSEGNPGNKPGFCVSMSTGGELDVSAESLGCDFGGVAEEVLPEGELFAEGVVGVGLSEGFLSRRRDILQTSNRRLGRVVPRSWRCSDPAKARIVNHPEEPRIVNHSEADEQTSERNQQ